MGIKKDKEVSKSLNKYIRDSVRNKHQNDCNIIKSKGESRFDLSGCALRKHLFHITVTYRRPYSLFRDERYVDFNKLDAHIKYINNEFEFLHKLISRELVSGNIYRQIHYQPYCIMALDASTTCIPRRFETDLAGNFTHHHGVMLIHPEQLADFIHYNAQENWDRIAKQTKNVATIFVQPVEAFNDYFISYNNKLASQLITRPESCADYFFSMPHASGERLDKLWGGVKQ